MNLVIDVGNTFIKFGVFNVQQLKLKKSCVKNDFLLVLEEVSQSFPDIKNTIIASVGKLEEEHLAKLELLYDVLQLDQHTKVPFFNKYSTPTTLGVDRIAVISAAAQQFTNKNVLVIDAGTCITYDFINSKNEYFGGAISPGITLRYQALNSFTRSEEHTSELQSRPHLVCRLLLEKKKKKKKKKTSKNNKYTQKNN